MNILIINLLMLFFSAIICLCVFSKKTIIHKFIALFTTFMVLLIIFVWSVSSDLTQIVQENVTFTLMHNPRLVLTFVATDISILFSLFVSLSAFVAVALSGSKLVFAREYFASLLALEFSALGIFVAGDFLTFSVFWIITAMPVAFLTGMFKKDEKDHSAVRSFIYLTISSLPLLIVSGALFARAHVLEFLPLAEAAKDFPINLSMLIGFTVLGSALLRMTVFPFHIWLRNPFLKMSSASCILVFSVLHLSGLYAILNICIQIFPQVFKMAAPYLVIVAVVGAVYGAIMALAQNSLRLMGLYMGLTFSSLSLAALSCSSKIGLSGAVYSSSALLWGITGFFAIVTIAEDRFKTSESKLTGLFVAMPKFATLSMFTLFTFAAVPLLPGFNTFFLTLSAVFSFSQAYSYVLSFVMLLCAAAAMKIVAQIFWGSSSAKRFVNDINMYEVMVLSLIALVLIICGTIPSVIFEQVNLSVNYLQSLLL